MEFDLHYHRQKLSDKNRLDFIKQLDLINSLPEESFDRLTRLAVRLLSTPVSLVSFVDDQQQFFKSAFGLDEPWASKRKTPLSHSFCQYVVSTGRPFIVEDAPEHPLVSDNLAIPELGVVSYLGIPITLTNGLTLGAFCVIDAEARQWTKQEIEMMHDLAQSVITEIELRYHIKQLQTTKLERDRLVSELQTREAYLKSLINSPNTFVLRTDMRGNFSYLNDAFRARYKWMISDTEELLGKSSLMTIVEDDHGKTRECIETCIKKPGQSCQITLRKLAQHGEPFIVLWNFSAITDTQGNITEIQCVGIDITEQKKAEQKAFELALEEEKLKILSEFIQDAAHEFRTPLSIINTSANFMVQFDDREKRQLRAHRITEQVSRITKLIDLLTFIAELETRKEIEFVPLNIDEIIQRVHDSLPPERLSQLEIDSLQMDTPMIYGIPEYLTRALHQLVDNALRFSPSNSTVYITSGFQDNSSVIAVKNTGTTIPPEDLPNLFKLFWRKDEAHTTSGFGIGLYIAQMIVERHRGRIEVESSEDTGTIFTIFLPASQS